jgi:adenylosuccinate lyase
VHAQAAAERLKEGAIDNDLIDRLKADPAFPRLDFARVLEPGRFTGRAAAQVEEFVAATIEPIRRRYPERLAADLDSAVRV